VEQGFLIIAKSCFTSVFNGDFELPNKIIKINIEYFLENFPTKSSNLLIYKIYWNDCAYFSSTVMDNIPTLLLDSY